MIKKENLRPLAVIIKGNPKYLEDPKVKPLAEKFYHEIKSLLERKGYRVQFDAGKDFTQPTSKAAVWIGHSRGIDRLRFAPKSVKTILLHTKDHTKHFSSNDERGLDPLHYELSDEDRKHIEDLP